MWPTLRQLWKEWYIFIIALCLLIIPVLLFAPQENTRFQSASNNVQSNKVENSANMPAAQNPGRLNRAQGRFGSRLQLFYCNETSEHYMGYENARCLPC